MAYQRQYYMLYPNYSNQTSFATNWLEPGEHIDKVVRSAIHILGIPVLLDGILLLLRHILSVSDLNNRICM
jgi:hypothetical protein